MVVLRRILFLAVVAMAGNVFGGGETAGPKKLTVETFEVIKARVSLTADDLAWQKVPWRSGFLEGLIEAQAADKPIFFWFYGGGSAGLASNC